MLTVMLMVMLIWGGVTLMLLPTMLPLPSGAVPYRPVGDTRSEYSSL